MIRALFLGILVSYMVYKSGTPYVREGNDMTEFDSNTFENDYILAVLSHMVTELKTERPVEQIIDKYAVELTAFMNGQIRSAVKTDTVDAEILEGVRILVDECTYHSRSRAIHPEETRAAQWLRRNLK